MVINIKKIQLTGLTGEYYITEDGKVWSQKNQKFLKQTPNHKGYLRVCLWVNGEDKRFFVHTLVANAFLEKPLKEGLTIDHIDGNKLNNHFSNLQWGDNATNIRNSYHNGSRDKVDYTGVKNPSNKYSENVILQVIQMLCFGYSYQTISEQTGVSKSTISAIKAKRIWRSLTNNIDFGVSQYENILPKTIQNKLENDIRLHKLTTTELLEKYNLDCNIIKYFKQKIKYDF